jgi:hypothetical protein
MSASTDRNLLFGILALKLDFISKDALIAAMNAWLLDKNRSLGDILTERRQLPPDRLHLLTALVAEHLKQHGGDPKRSLAAVSLPVSAQQALESIADADVQQTLAQVGIICSTSATPRLNPARSRNDRRWVPNGSTAMASPYTCSRSARPVSCCSELAADRLVPTEIDALGTTRRKSRWRGVTSDFVLHKSSNSRAGGGVPEVAALTCLGAGLAASSWVKMGHPTRSLT